MRLAAILKLRGLSPERARLLKVEKLTLNGVDFLIRALTPLDFLGYNHHAFASFAPAEHKISDGLSQKKAEAEFLNGQNDMDNLRKKMASIYKPIFMRAVLWPRIHETEDSSGICVDDLVADAELASTLYRRIFEISVKKKNGATSWKSRLWSWMFWRKGMGAGRVSSAA